MTDFRSTKAERLALRGSTTTMTGKGEKGEQPATLFARARAGLDDLDVPGGRYAAQQAHFPGEGSYPSGAGWVSDAALVGPEAPLGIAIDAQQEPVGTYVEIQRSIEALAAPPAIAVSPDETSPTAPAGPPSARLPGDVPEVKRRRI